MEVLLATKEANPKLSVQLVIRETLKHRDVPDDLPLPPSTVHRLLARHGLMSGSDSQDTDTDRRRFAFQSPG
uniref:Homeodomain-like domain-containing protein n=2 Tax=Candidatus Kentrum sp. TUN TaxID=2126343 RepID=A0A451B441_9GAMM|nr:MAG: hypothetical protein BECKTUN1418E_GA0071001_13902 [Candidatus Kentron sp. TUN]VFK73058.1 MAG: hypothetical protein BECKTUN1418E_GA0071001_15692 [Candidatus Kentron sp. TUN]